MIQRMVKDYKYPKHVVTNQEIIEKLGREYPIHLDPGIKEYAHIWNPIEVTFILNGDSTDTPSDLSVVSGHVYLSERAYDVLKDLFVGHGEFLPVNYPHGHGYIFNPLKVAEDMNAVNGDIRDKYNNLLGFTFDEGKLDGVPVFKTHLDVQSVLCSEAVIDLIKRKELSGVKFESTEQLYLP